MCKWGDTVLVKVKILGNLAFSGKSYWINVPVDKCIAPIVKALQEAGINMLGSCCGHESGVGKIVLQDGRTLIIKGE